MAINRLFKVLSYWSNPTSCENILIPETYLCCPCFTCVWQKGLTSFSKWKCSQACLRTEWLFNLRPKTDGEHWTSPCAAHIRPHTWFIQRLGIAEPFKRSVLSQIQSQQWKRSNQTIPTDRWYSCCYSGQPGQASFVCLGHYRMPPSLCLDWWIPWYEKLLGWSW